MEDTVIIRKGLPEGDSWEINNVNTNLKSLVAAKLALIGEARYEALDVQTEVLSKISEKLNVVSDKLDEIAEISKLPPPAISPTDATFSTKFSFPSFLPITDPAIVAAKELIAQTGKLFSSTGDFPLAMMSAILITSKTDPSQALIARGPVARLDASFFQDFTQATFEQATTGYLPGQYFELKNKPPLEGFSFMVKGYAPPNSSVNSFNFEYFAIPKTKQEIFNWNYPVQSLESAIKFTDSLLDANTILVPNSNPDGKPSNAVTMAVKVDSYDAVKYVSGFGTFYTAYPLETMTDDAAKAFFAGTIFKNEKGLIGIVNPSQEVIRIDESKFKFFIVSPSAEQVLGWRGEYAEKQVFLSQRSSEQQLFLTELQQKFVYIYNIATDIYKALTSVQERIASSNL